MKNNPNKRPYNTIGLEPGDTIKFTYKPFLGIERAYECKVVSVGKRSIVANILDQDPAPVLGIALDEKRRFSINRMR